MAGALMRRDRRRRLRDSICASVVRYRCFLLGLTGGLLLPMAISVLAEDLTLTTYYPSPRGVYRALRIGAKSPDDPTAALSLNLVHDVTKPVALRIDNPKDASAPVIVRSDTGDTQWHVLINGTTVPPTRPALHANGAIEADTFRAFQESGWYAFVEAGPNYQPVRLGGFSLATNSFIPTLLDGNPLTLNGASGGEIRFGAPACFGADCRTRWPGSAGEDTDTLQSGTCPAGTYQVGVDFVLHLVWCRAF